MPYQSRLGDAFSRIHADQASRNQGLKDRGRQATDQIWQSITSAPLNMYEFRRQFEEDKLAQESRQENIDYLRSLREQAQANTDARLAAEERTATEQALVSEYTDEAGIFNASAARADSRYTPAMMERFDQKTASQRANVINETTNELGARQVMFAEIREAALAAQASDNPAVVWNEFFTNFNPKLERLKSVGIEFDLPNLGAIWNKEANAQLLSDVSTYEQRNDMLNAGLTEALSADDVLGEMRSAFTILESVAHDGQLYEQTVRSLAGMFDPRIMELMEGAGVSRTWQPNTRDEIMRLREELVDDDTGSTTSTPTINEEAIKKAIANREYPGRDISDLTPEELANVTRQAKQLLDSDYRRSATPEFFEDREQLNRTKANLDEPVQGAEETPAEKAVRQAAYDREVKLFNKKHGIPDAEEGRKWYDAVKEKLDSEGYESSHEDIRSWLMDEDNVRELRRLRPGLRGINFTNWLYTDGFLNLSYGPNPYYSDREVGEGLAAPHIRTGRPGVRDTRNVEPGYTMGGLVQ